MLLGILAMIIFIPVFWALVIRPQQKAQAEREAQHQAVVDSLVPGDRVESFSGIHGTLVQVGEATVEIEIADGVVATMARQAVSTKIEPGGHDDEQEDQS
ncbi:MAG: yajC [Ilumatobacteraceae bacterium]|nr:yajC [Ilumatobacteraceae bacterium]